MPVGKQLRFIHRIEFWRESGNAADPDSEVSEVLIGRARADRKDVRGTETRANGADVLQVANAVHGAGASLGYANAAGERASASRVRHGRIRRRAVGRAPGAADYIGMGNEPEEDWIVRDPGRAVGAGNARRDTGSQGRKKSRTISSTGR